MILKSEKNTKLSSKNKPSTENNTEEVVSIIKYAIEHLADTELLKENGWNDNNFKIIDDLLNKDFIV